MRSCNGRPSDKSCFRAVLKYVANDIVCVCWGLGRSEEDKQDVCIFPFPREGRYSDLAWPMVGVNNLSVGCKNFHVYRGLAAPWLPEEEVFEAVE